MKGLKENLEKANELVEKIGVENIWDVDVSEYSIRILAYKDLGVEEKALALGFEAEDATYFKRVNQIVVISRIEKQ